MNINIRPTVLNTIQASGADVSLSNGVLAVTGCAPIPVLNVQEVSILPSLTGLGISYTITLTTTIAANTIYEVSIQQLGANNELYTYTATVETGAVAPTATAFYNSLGAKLQDGVNGGQILGTVVINAGTNVVFTTSVVAPQALFGLSNLSVSTGTTTLTALGSSATNAAPRVFTAGAAHNLVVGGVYNITFSGVTGAGAPNVNGTRIGIVTGSTTIVLVGTADTGIVDTTAATITVVPNSVRNLRNFIGGDASYSASKAYLGFHISYRDLAGIAQAPVNEQFIVLNATDNSAANYNAAFRALVAALDGSNAAEMVAKV